MNDSGLHISPRLPGIFRLPFKFTPDVIHDRLFLRSLNTLFRNELAEGELDFMTGRSMAIQVIDAGLWFHFSLQDDHFEKANSELPPDLTIAGSLYDFLLLVSRREDPDTLFFNRRLKLSGDTELGLYVKNFLDAVDLAERFQLLHRVSLGVSRLVEKLHSVRTKM